MCKGQLANRLKVSGWHRNKTAYGTARHVIKYEVTDPLSAESSSGGPWVGRRGHGETLVENNVNGPEGWESRNKMRNAVIVNDYAEDRTELTSYGIEGLPLVLSIRW